MHDIQRVDKALQYLDKLFTTIPEFANFNVSDIMVNSGWEPEEVEDGYDLDSIIQILLIDRLKYATGKEDGYWIKLNDLGRQVKSKGGHFAYLKCLDNKAKIDAERQRLNDEKLKYDVKNSKRIFKTYWWTFGIAIAGFLLALGKIIYDILMAD